MQSAGEVEKRLRQNELPENATRIPDKETLTSLAHDLPALWNSATTEMRLKQRIIRILIEEIIADVDEATSEIVLMIHWTCGRHSELRVKKNLTGKHSRCTSLAALEIIRQMAGNFPDDQIAATLNRLNLRTGAGNTWTEGRIRSLRSYHDWATYDPKTASRQALTLEEASQRLGVRHKVVRRLINAGKISGTQVVLWAPWEISLEAVGFEEVLEAVRNAKRRVRVTSSAFEPVLPLFADS